ncbi:MAG: trypsin-like serine protease [Myxococcota bacterium]
MHKSQGFVTVWAGAVIAFLSCGPSVEGNRSEAEGVTREAIVGGSVTSGDPAVVVLAVNTGGGLEEYCTGTLIAPKTVLTAAHCIEAYGPGNFYVVGFGSNINALNRTVSVAQQIDHPSYNGRSFDFGVLRLAQAVSGVTPIAINERPMSAADVGRPIRHVGFGITNASGVGGGIKREVTYNLREVRNYTIESGANGKQTCSGDSGGPGFMVMPGDSVEKVAGVVSYGDENCVIEGYDGRVDVAASWIKAQMAQWEQPTCATDGACVPGCTPVDQDCACAADGRCTADCADLTRDPDCPRDCARNNVCAQAECPAPDPDCIAVGGACTVAASCRERLCVSDSQHPQTYCSKGCSGSADCPSGMECGSGTCRYPLKPERQLFDTCSASEDYCVASICTGPVGGLTRCVASCLVTSDCPSGSVCEAGADSRRFCRPADLRFTPTVLPAARAEGPVASTGCSAVGPGLPSLWLLALALPALRRRRSVA